MKKIDLTPFLASVPHLKELARARAAAEGDLTTLRPLTGLTSTRDTFDQKRFLIAVSVKTGGCIVGCLIAQLKKLRCVPSVKSLEDG
jgi:hypothetical protein